MPTKLPYFVKDRGKPKFKRAVPADIQALVGLKNWTKRVGKLSSAQLRSEAIKFAAVTEHEIERYRQERAKPLAEPKLSVGRYQQVVDEIVARYRREREEGRLRSGAYFIPADAEPLDVLYEAELDVMRAVVNANELSSSPTKAAGLLVRYGFVTGAREDQPLALGKLVSLLSDESAFEKLCSLLEMADVHLAQSRLQALSKHDFSGVPSQNVGNGVPVTASQKQVTLKYLTDEFLKSKPENLTKSRVSQLKLPIQLMHEKFGAQTLITSIQREECRAFAKLLPKIPGYLHHHYRGMTMEEAAEEHFRKHGKDAARHVEAQKMIQIIRSIFDMAVNERWLVDGNPWDGLSVRQRNNKKYQLAKSKYDPFPVEALNKLFALPLFAGKQGPEEGSRHFLTHRYWAPIISLFSGMRMNEILQLERADIQTNADGIVTFSVTDEEAEEYDPREFDKRLKTEKSLRRIPIHPTLHDIGFVAWATTRSAGRLFPEAAKGSGEKPSDLYSKRFRTDIKNAGIWVHRRQVFHSFRHNFNAALKAAGVPEDCREAINGWSHQRTMDSHYGSGKTDQRLFEELKKVDYPGLDISALMTNAKFIIGS